MLPQVLHGRPTQRQAERLVNHVVAMGVDQIVTHEQIEALIGVERATEVARYQTVLGAAKKRLLREHGIELISVRGTGFRYPTGDAQIRSSVGHIRRGVKKIGHGVKVGGQVADKRLTVQGCEMRDHIVGQAKYLFELGRTQRKALELTVGKTDTNPTGKV